MIRQQSAKMIRVILVDDHVVVRSGFAQLLSLEDDIDVVGQYSSAAAAWPALLRDDVSVAVMDIAMPDENGLSLLKRLRAQKPQFRAIILSIYDSPTFVQSALDAGARAAAPHGLFHTLLHRLRIAHVHPQRHHPPAVGIEPRGGGGERRCVAAGHHHRGSAPKQLAGDRFANAGGRAGHQRHPMFEILHSRSPATLNSGEQASAGK